MAGFFHILPSKLQIDILQTWVEDNEHNRTRLLSRMDIACSTSTRPAFLALLALPAWSWCGLTDDKLVKEVKDMLGFFLWLQDRRIAVKSLFITEGPGHELEAFNQCKHLLRGPLEHIKTIQLGTIHSGSGLLAVLAACPNLTEVHCHPRQPCDLIWAALPQAKLQIKKFVASAACQLFDDSICSALRAMLEVEELRVREVKLSPAVLNALQACLSIKIMEISVDKMPTESVVKLLSSCQIEHLQCFGCLGLLSAGLEDIAKILQAGQPHLQRLIINLFTNPNPCAVLGELLHRCPWIDLLSVNQCAFQRSTAELKMITKGALQKIEELDCLLDACGAVKVLDVSGPLDSALVLRTGERCGSSLTRLNAAISSTPTEPLLALCPMLKVLNLPGGNASEQMLLQIASLCKQLEVISICAFNSAGITDAGLMALISSCPHLKELHVSSAPKVTARTLQAILDSKLALRKMTWYSAGISQAEIVQFQAYAKECGLLPVCVFVKL